MIYLIFLTYILSELFDSQMDTIKFRPLQAWLQSEWYLRNNWGTKNWLLKVPFSFLNDGWHFIKGLRIVTINIIAALLLRQYLHINFILLVLGLYIVHGIIFETFYGRKL